MPGTENPNLPTYGLSEAAVEERQPEVPNASFEGGGNEAASNSPGIGINTGDYDPKPSDWSREERAPQNFGHIGLEPSLAGDIRVDNPLPGDSAAFVQASQDVPPGEFIPGTAAKNATGATVPAGAWLWAPAAQFVPESLALFEVMTPEPDDQQKAVINSLMVNGLLPLWDKMDGFYILHSYAEQPSLINWRSPSEEAVPEGDPQFTPFSGWAGDGVGAYISIPTSLSSYTQNSAHYGSAQAESIAGAGTFRVSDSGTSGATRLMFYNQRSSSNFINMRINSVTSFNPSPYGDDTALAIVDRINDDIKVYQNGSEVYSQTSASSGLPTMPFMLLNSNSVFSEATINFFCFGGHLTAQESANLSQAWLSYLADMQEIGAFSLEDGDGLLLTEGGDEIGTEGV